MSTFVASHDSVRFRPGGVLLLANAKHNSMRFRAPRYDAATDLTLKHGNERLFVELPSLLMPGR